jgi:hypothetical protein
MTISGVMIAHFRLWRLRINAFLYFLPHRHKNGCVVGVCEAFGIVKVGDDDPVLVALCSETRGVGVGSIFFNIVVL